MWRVLFNARVAMAFGSVRQPDEMEFKMKAAYHGSCPLRSRLAAFGSGTCRSLLANIPVVRRYQGALLRAADCSSVLSLARLISLITPIRLACDAVTVAIHFRSIPRLAAVKRRCPSCPSVIAS
jgi:hypothetical protein